MGWGGGALPFPSSVAPPRSLGRPLQTAPPQALYPQPGRAGCLDTWQLPEPGSQATSWLEASRVLVARGHSGCAGQPRRALGGPGPCLKPASWRRRDQGPPLGIILELVPGTDRAAPKPGWQARLSGTACLSFLCVTGGAAPAPGEDRLGWRLCVERAPQHLHPWALDSARTAGRAGRRDAPRLSRGDWTGQAGQRSAGCS